MGRLGAGAARHVEQMREPRQHNRIGQHAVVELHGQRVLEEIAPRRLLEEQPVGRRDEGAVDQRPGVVDSGRHRGRRPARRDRSAQHQNDEQRSRSIAARRGTRRAAARGRAAAPSTRAPRRSHRPASDGTPAGTARRSRGRQGPRTPSTSRPRPAARRARKCPQPRAGRGSIQPRQRNHTNGSRNAAPISRPSRRCVHSHQ